MQFFEKIARMWLRQLPLFIMLVIYSVGPTYFYGWYSPKTLIVFVLPQTVLPALLLCILADRRRWLWWVVFVLANLLWLIEMECYFCQRQRMCSIIALLIAQSNPQESAGYLSIAYPFILKGMGVWAACATFFFLCCRLWRGLPQRTVTRPHATRTDSLTLAAMGLLLSLSVIYSPAAFFAVIGKGKEYINRLAYATNLNSWSTWPLYVYILHDTFDNPDIKQIPQLKETLESVKVSTDNAKDSLSIVYVIGESFPRSRSSLYGYPYSTNPLMAKELADSSLILYSNMISLSHYTSDVYRCMMSTYDPQSGNDFGSYPLFPGLMKKAGYRVANYDNQALIRTGAADIVCNYFFTDLDICDLCIDLYNDRLMALDRPFVETYPPLTGDSHSKNLTIYHLKGQHAPYIQQYPEGYSHFTTDDYRRFDGLSDQGAATMSEFDNATRYNDLVIHTIIDSLRDKTAILIYSPDHGDEVFDYRESSGRWPDAPLTSIRLFYEVPVMIWLSDSFRHRYPDIAAALRRNTGKAIYNSDLPHTILDIAGVETATFNPAVSLLRDGPGRLHRHVRMGNTDYDARRGEIYRQKLRYEE